MKKMALFILLTVTVVTATAVASGSRFPVARKLIHSQGCKACHRLEGAGGDYAVPLDGVGSRRSFQQLRVLLESGKNSPTEPYMPSYSHLSEEELERLVEFLLSLK